MGPLDCFCENGYTCCFYFHNVAALKKYLICKCSPIHARVLFLFDQPPYKIIVVGLENLYISAQICRKALIGMSHVMVHGVWRKDAAIHPMSYKKVKKAEQAAVMGTNKSIGGWL